MQKKFIKSQEKLYNELSFLVSDYNNEDYYLFCKKEVEIRQHNLKSFLSKLKR